MDRALEVIRNRIDEFGVTEPVVQRAGERRIVVELAGIQDPERAQQIISKAAVLEFQMVRTGSETRRLVEKLDRELARRAGVETPADTASAADGAGADSAASDSAEAEESAVLADTAAAEDSFLEAPPPSMAEDIAATAGRPLEARITYERIAGDAGDYERAFVAETDVERLSRYLARCDSLGLVPDDVEWLWGSDSYVRGAGPVRDVYLCTKDPELTGEVLEAASAQPDPNGGPGTFLVQFDLDRMGRRLFSSTTGENVGRPMAIVLDGRVRSAPQIQGKIRGGTATITRGGGFPLEEAQDLSIVLNAGALPVPVRVEEERAVGPSLGRDSIEMGRNAILYGFAFVLVFMLIYYRLSGLIAVVALLLNLVLMLAVMVGMFQAVLTLPGIAGFVLTVGMAVDANVLIFERIREELRNQQTFRNAINRGYERAFRTIFDANLTTFITAVALLWFGTGPIRGFAVVLSIGIVVSMFTALFVTRLIFDLLTRPGGMRQVSI
jgi:protein-export membrane protein SecD